MNTQKLIFPVLLAALILVVGNAKADDHNPRAINFDHSKSNIERNHKDGRQGPVPAHDKKAKPIAPPNLVNRDNDHHPQVQKNKDNDHRDHDRGHKEFVHRPILPTVYSFFSPRPYIGMHVSFLSAGYWPTWANGIQYYYSNGDYYIRQDMGYTMVMPPVGATVFTLPQQYQEVEIYGRTYYTNNGVYYIHTPSGYEVVPPPVNVVSGDSGVYTINVPARTGGYVAITIQKSNDGFIGPQGELYTEFPPVSQLSAMYGQ